MTREPWKTRNLAVQGALVGIVMGTGFAMSAPLRPNFDVSEPFYWAFLEIIGCGAACALLFAGLAWIHNRMFRA
jgi:hypothetical protein